jgi:hypothetical protein
MPFGCERLDGIGEPLHDKHQARKLDSRLDAELVARSVRGASTASCCVSAPIADVHSLFHAARVSKSAAAQESGESSALCANRPAHLGASHSRGKQTTVVAKASLSADSACFCTLL